MKRICTVLLIFLLLCSISIPCFAAGTDSTQINVYAKAVRTTGENCYEAPLDGREASITTADGTSITVSLDGSQDLFLVVYEVTAADADAYSWFQNSTEGLGKNRKYYDIFFVDAEGNMVDAGNANVTVKLPADAESTKVSLLTTDGTTTRLSSSQSGRTVSFTISGNGYYVIASGSSTTIPTDPDNPKTGDSSCLLLWFILLLLSCCGGVAIVIRMKTGSKTHQK